MLVRHEAGGRLPQHAKLGMFYSQDQAKANDMMEEDLATDTKNMVLDSSLKVVAGKAGVPLSALFDLKTHTIKSQHRNNILNEQLPRLWIRQLPFFIVAYHEPGSGCFHPVNTKISNVTIAIVEWEQYNEDDLRKLVSLNNKIVSTVKQMPDSIMGVRCSGDEDVLDIRS